MTDQQCFSLEWEWKIIPIHNSGDGRNIQLSGIETLMIIFRDTDKWTVTVMISSKVNEERIGKVN